MTKKKQALWRVIGTVAILVSLSGTIYYTVKENSTVKVQERVQKVSTLKDINRIEYKADELVGLEKTAEGWHNPELSYLDYSETDIESWLESIDRLETTKIVKNVEDETQYGFNETSTMVTFYDAMNQSETLYMGQVNEDEKALYIKSDQEDVIFMVALEEGQTLFTSPNQFVKCDDIVLPQITEAFSLVVEDEIKFLQTQQGKWYLEDYFEMPNALKEEVMSELIEAIHTLEVMRYVGTYEDLSAFGLGKPRLQVIVGTNEKIAFGDETGKEVYITLNEGKDVYTVDKALYTVLEAFKPFEAIERAFIQWPAEHIKQIELSNPQGTYRLVLEQSLIEAIQLEELEAELALNEAAESQQTKEEVAKESEESTDQIEALFNKQSLSLAEAEAWIQKINESLIIEAPLQNPKIEQKQERKAEATIEYTLENNERVVVELVPYDINYYILRYNGSVHFAVNKEKVTKLFTELNHLDKKSEK